MILRIEIHIASQRAELTVDVPSHDRLWWRRGSSWAKLSYPARATDRPGEALREAVREMARAMGTDCIHCGQSTLDIG